MAAVKCSETLKCYSDKSFKAFWPIEKKVVAVLKLRWFNVFGLKLFGQCKFYIVY